MTTELSRKGPGISIAQMIGDDARSALYANKPQQWLLGEIGGDDFGVDFQVTAFGEADTGAQCYFNIQLKGTTQSSARSKDGAHLAYPFDRKTLNLWCNSGLAILVVVADLIDTRDPKEARVHFHFANPDLDEILPGLPSDQKTVTLRVPTSQVVHRDLDILSVVLPYLDEIKDLRRQAKEKRRAAGEPSSETVSIAAVSGNASGMSEVSSSADEIESVINTVPHKAELRAALAALRSGNYDRVLLLALPPSIEVAETASQEVAVRAYLRARALEEIGESAAADAMVDVAASILPNNDDVATLIAQRALNALEFGPEGQEARQALLDSLSANNGAGITNLKAKVYALGGDFETAREILKALPPEKAAIAIVTISIIERAWNRALSEIKSSLSLPSMTDRQIFWLNAFEAKAHLELALAGVARPAEGEFIVPSTGLPGIDYGKLRDAYDASLKTMLAAQRLNWPATIRYVMDVFPISSMLLGYATDALPLLAALALTRPTVTPIRECVAKFAVQFGQPQIAVQLSELAGDSEKFEHESAVMAVAAYKAGNVGKALSYVTDEFLADPSDSDVYLSSLLMMGMAANATLSLELFEKIRARLDRDTQSRHYRAIMESAVQVQQSLLRRPEANRRLYAHWASQGRPALVGQHLLDNSDPTDAAEATLIVEVGTNLEGLCSLGAEHFATLGSALITLGEIDEAISCLRRANERFDDEPRLKSLMGIALELNGQSPEAFQLIGRLLESGEASETARRYFIQIAARIGFFDIAEEQVRAALAKATTSSRRLQHLNTLFQLLLAAGDRPKDVEEVAWQYGKLARQENEREEGIFLQEYLVATLPHGLDLPPERVLEFRRRLETYNEQFPKSKYLWRANIPIEGPPDAMVAALQEAAGITDQDIAEASAIERKMDQGALHVPFSWRPRRFLRNISDVFMLWQIRKQASLEKAAFHFQCSLAGYDRHTPPDLKNAKAVISLTSLLVLEEIGLLGTVLNAFQTLIVARSTLVTLQEARNAFAAGWGREKAARIMRELQERFAKITHPPYPTEDYRRGLPDWYHEEKIAMRQPGCVYFCDDIIETVLVCGAGDKEPAKPSMSTVDFLNWADQFAGILTAPQVADALGFLARLKIGAVTIQQRYFVAAIPEALQLATTLAAEDQAIAGSEAFRSILDGLWDSSKPFDALRTHFAQTMSYLLNKGNASEAVLVALWLRWLQSVRFQRKPALTVLWKLGIGFISTLALIETDKRIVRRLWQSFWTAIRRGLVGELQESEDNAGVKIIAEVLGRGRAQDGGALQAGLLFEKARVGLEEGTELDAEFGRIYVDCVATQTRKQLESRQG